MNIPTTFFDLLILSLATWRISSLLVHEDGPYAVFRRGREFMERNGLELFWQLFQCVWCTSVWIGAGMMVAWNFYPEYTRVFSVWLSLSAISIVVQIWVRDEDEEDLPVIDI